MNRVDLERDYWDKAALDPDVDTKYISDVSTEEMIEALGDDVAEPGTLFLDVGCGVGRISNDLGAIGIDISKNMLEIARKNEFFDEQYHLSDGRTIPFTDNFFESAYSMLLFQHLKDDAIANYLIQVNRVLKPDGVFRFQFIQGTEKEPFSNHYSLEQIKIWCDMAGLKIEKVDEGLVHPQWTWITARKPNV